MPAVNTATFEHLAAERARLNELILQSEREVLDEQQAIDLRRQRNYVAPISVLPTDLLLEVFYWYKDQAEETMDWITALTHVCYYWREIAISSGSLWTKPVFTQPDLAAEMIRRSRTSPLDVVLSSWNNDHLTESENLIANILASESHRIHILDLAARPQCLEELLRHATGPAPLLIRLAVQSRTSDDVIRIQIPRNLFAGQFSNLHELVLENCNFEFIHPRYDNLYLLDITSLDLRSAPYVHSVLKSMPRLKQLYISSPILSSPSRSLQPPVELPIMSNLRMTGTIDCLATILSCFKCSVREFHLPDLYLHIECTTSVPSASLDHLTEISSWISAGVRVTLTALSIDANYKRAKVRCFTDHDFLTRDHTTQSPLHLELSRASLRLQHHLDWRHAEALISHFDLAHTEHIILGGSYTTFAPEAGCLSLFARARNTVALSIFSSTAAVLGALRQQQAVAVLPELRYIMMGYVDVISELHLWADVLHSRLPQDDTTIRALLSLRGCAPRAPQINPLLSQYPRVEFRWDGRELRRQTATKAARRI